MAPKNNLFRFHSREDGLENLLQIYYRARPADSDASGRLARDESSQPPPLLMKQSKTLTRIHLKPLHQQFLMSSLPRIEKGNQFSDKLQNNVTHIFPNLSCSVG